jgi:pentatricopeptide repeat protein
MMPFGQTLADVSEVLAPMWLEILFMVFFVLGFALIPRTRSDRKKKWADDTKSHLLHKQIGSDVEAGHTGAALKSWHAVKMLAPAPIETLKIVLQVLLEMQPETLVEELIEHFRAHGRRGLNGGKSATAVLDVVARAGRVDILDELADDFRNQLQIRPSAYTYEVLLGGHASAGDEKRVSELCTEMSECRQKMTARGYSLTIKGFLKNGLVDAASQKIQEMHQRGFTVPSFAVAQLFRTAFQNDRGIEIFEATLKAGVQLQADAITVLLEDCCKRNDLALALRVEKVVRDNSNSENPLPNGAYDSLLKVCVAHADVRAIELFQNMQKEDVRISDGLCIGLLARCADTKFLRFAEEIVGFIRGRNGMSIASYSALMKVYAYCGMYDKACDLYAQIRDEGLEPDSMMYGCLMKFSVECGRTELSRELFDKSPSLDIQNYMSLIRAASKDRDVNRAFAVLAKLKASGVSVDIAAYNCVLDACASCGDLKRARGLIQEMKTITNLDIVTYNTLLKGYCSKGDLQGAKDLFREMKEAGLPPNDVSYNCLINAAVSSGNFWEAWNIVDMMEKAGVAVDHYTISIMMKALKRVKDPKDVHRALELLDRSGVDVCSDEVLLNTVLETCTRHRQSHRLETIISSFSSSKLRPSVHTYGSLIKASSTLKRLEKCYEFWNTMVDQWAMEPNDIVLGCMLDALVCNDRVEDAVTLLRKWKSTITPNTIMFSTIIKGFANSRQASRALDMWREMCDLGLTFNIVVYNALIDSQARVGAMDEVTKLVQSMEPNGCSPDNITYSTIVKGYCVKGDLDKAFEVFRSMQSNKMALDSIVYNTIMDGCTRHNRMDLVDKVLEDMEKFNIKPSNFTLGILMKMYGRRHQLDKAFQVIEELPKRHGLHVNSQVRTSLMGACLSNHDTDRAMQVFEDLKAGGGADAKAYSSLLYGLVRLGEFAKAVALIKDAYGLGNRRRVLPAGQFLEAEALEQLMRGLSHRPQTQSVGIELLEELRAAGVPVSSRLFSSSMQNARGR